MAINNTLALIFKTSIFYKVERQRFILENQSVTIKKVKTPQKQYLSISNIRMNNEMLCDGYLKA